MTVAELVKKIEEIDQKARGKYEVIVSVGESGPRGVVDVHFGFVPVGSRIKPCMSLTGASPKDTDREEK